MSDKQQLAAMGEHMREMEECKPVFKVPDGWRLVPADVSLRMQRAYFDIIDKNMRRVETDCRFGRYDSAKEAYRAMLAAAPEYKP